MTLGIHAQAISDPAATDLILFTCPTDSFVSSRLFVCNRGGATTFSVAVVPASFDGLSPLPMHYLHFAEPLAANTTYIIPAGITLQRADQLFIASASTAVTFTLFGEAIGGSE